MSKISEVRVKALEAVKARDFERLSDLLGRPALEVAEKVGQIRGNMPDWLGNIGGYDRVAFEVVVFGQMVEEWTPEELITQRLCAWAFPNSGDPQLDCPILIPPHNAAYCRCCRGEDSVCCPSWYANNDFWGCYNQGVTIHCKNVDEYGGFLSEIQGCSRDQAAAFFKYAFGAIVSRLPASARAEKKGAIKRMADIAKGDLSDIWYEDAETDPAFEFLGVAVQMFGLDDVPKSAAEVVEKQKNDVVWWFITTLRQIRTL